MRDYKKYNERKLYEVADFLHRHIILIIIAFVVVMSAISMIIIANQRDSEKNTDEANTNYEKTSQISIPMLKVESLNPLISGDKDTYNISNLIYNGLFKLNEKLQIENDLVDSYSTEREAGVVNINLKNGVVFSDGEALTANDVIYTINQIKSIGSASLYFNYVDKIQSVQGSGLELKITFKSPYDASISNLTFPIVSKRSYSKKADEMPVGTGKYKVKEYDPNKKLVLEGNSSSFSGAPKNTIEFSIVENYDNTIGLISMNSLTCYVDENSNAISNAQSKNLKYHSFLSNQQTMIAFNFSSPHSSQKHFRKAVAYAINRENIIKENFSEQSVASADIFPPNFLGMEYQNTYKYNLTKSRRELEKAGYVDVNGDNAVEDKNGNPFTLSVIVLETEKNRVFAAESIKKYLTKVGITTNIEVLGKEDFDKRLEDKDFDIAIVGFKMDKSISLKEMFDSRNKIGYNNEVVMKKVDESSMALTEPEREKKLSQLRELLDDDLPYLSIGYATYTFITVDRFSFKTLPVFFNYFNGIEDWAWEKAVQSNS